METIFISWTQFGLVCATFALAQAVYVTFGFGAGLISVGLLAMIVPNVQDIVVMLLLVSMPTELMVVYQSRKAINWRKVLGVCAGVAVGVPLGTHVLKTAEPGNLLIILGGFLLVAGLVFLVAPEKKVTWSGWTGPPVGLVSGVLGGMFGTGGPPIIIYYQMSGIGKNAFRGALMTIFLLVTMVRLPSYAFAGLITETRMWSSLAVFPAVLLGAAIGHRAQLDMTEAAFRRLVSVALVILGAILVARRLL